MRSNTILSLQASGVISFLSGALLVVLGSVALLFVANLFPYYPSFSPSEQEGLLPIFVLAISILFGTAIVTIMAGYGLLKARKGAWKAAVIISTFQIALGLVLIFMIGTATSFDRLLVIPEKVVRLDPLEYASIIALIFIIGGALLLALLTTRSAREHFRIYVRGGRIAAYRNLKIAAVVVGIATFGYAYANGAFDASDSGEHKITTEAPYTLSIRTETVVDDLGQCGTSFVFVPDGRIFCAEVKSGKVRVIENSRLLPEPLIQLDVYHTTWGKEEFSDHRGLLGIAIDPDFERNHYVYLHWTYLDSEDNQSYNRVARFTESNNKLSEMKTLVDKIPDSDWHNGGAPEFGYDGKLYVVTGDAGYAGKATSNLSQDMDSLAGKILRINPDDGTVPEDNPFPGLPYYTMGHRNIFGIGFHPVTKVPYVTDNGFECCDEIDILTPGSNYGHPYFAGKQISDNIYSTVGTIKLIEDSLLGRERYIDPLLEFTPVIAPTELIFYTGDKYPGEVNNMFFLSFIQRELYRVILSPPDYDEVLSVETHLINIDGTAAAYPGVDSLPGGGFFNSLLDIEQGPDGYLYVSSFNKIMRLHFDYSDLPTSISLDTEPNDVGGGTPSSARLAARVSDYFGNPVPDVPIDFFDSDVLIGSAMSNQGGVAELEYAMDGEEEEEYEQHVIIAKFGGGDRYRASSSQEWVLEQ